MKVIAFYQAIGAGLPVLIGIFTASVIDVYKRQLLGCDYTGLKKENVTVNGVEADAFETTWSGFPYNKDYQRCV